MKTKNAGLVLYRSDVLPDNPAKLDPHGNLLCPSCGGTDTGYYEVYLRRRRAVVALEGLNGYHLEVEAVQEVKDVTDRVICDCAVCGYEWVPVLGGE